MYGSYFLSLIEIWCISQSFKNEVMLTDIAVLPEEALQTARIIELAKESSRKKCFVIV